MSSRLISLNSDLSRLKDDGYDVEVLPGYLLVKGVPYVTAQKVIKRGVLVSVLTLSGETAVPPTSHVAMFAGEYPCDRDGVEIEQIRHAPSSESIAGRLLANYSFSAKPVPNLTYDNYYHKMTAYIAILSGPAGQLDPGATARSYLAHAPEDHESVFNYHDTASSRAGIDAATSKLEVAKIAIIGLGGTGSYVLDLISKTPAGEIRLFDGDTFFNHNAFRSPGAATIDDLNKGLPKVQYFKDRYQAMHRNIVVHNCYIDDTNFGLLQGMNFVFLCLDRGGVKKQLIEWLEQFRVPFIDVGMGVDIVDGSLVGILRTTTSTETSRDHVRSRVSFADGDGNDDYTRNIQVADLNALNASLAVIKYKKFLGFYQDARNEYNSNYSINANTIVNEDCHEE